MTDIISRVSAALADRYRIESHLGEGGMATVYLAEDLKHERKVAIKILRPELAAVLGAERFLQEIKTTANLQHPNILPLFDSGAVTSAGGAGQAGRSEEFLYYVMPFIDGETLREKLKRETQFGIDETVKLTTEIADALDYAHRNNVIHRDIKPENILLHDGRPVVADFGIALAISQAGGGGRLTETGLSLGTPHYMSPEQATGDRELDARSDVYSLGALAYEMLTGDPPHSGNTVQAIVAKILTEAPSPISRTRSMVPPNIDAAVQVALAKSPADRFTSARRFAEAIVDPNFVLPADKGSSKIASRSPLASYGWPTATALLGLLALWLMFTSPADEPAPVIRVAVSLPADQALISGSAETVTVAPDGSFFVYAGATGLWMRRFDELRAEPIPGSDFGRGPRVSPDGTRVSFMVWDGLTWNVKVASLADGTTRDLTDIGGAPPAEWGPDDHVYFQSSGEAGRGLWRVSASGGTPERVTVVDSAQGEFVHNRPARLPNGRILHGGTRGGLAVVDPETLQSSLFEIRGTYPLYVPTGYVVTLLGGTLRAIRFDPDVPEFIGDHHPLPFQARTGAFGSVDVSWSETGTMIYVSIERRKTELVMVDRSGRAEPVDPAWVGSLDEPRISPDGTSIIGSTRSSDGQRFIAVKPLGSGPLRPVTFDQTNPGRASWHPDGTRFLYISGGQPYIGTLDGRAPVPVGEQDSHLAIWSDDGDWIVTQANGPTGTRDIFIQHVHPDSTRRPLIASEVRNADPVVSPDGRHIAYVVNATGQGEVMVRPFPNVDDGRVQVSLNGGYSPTWSPDGRELYFHDGSGRLLAAQLAGGDPFRVESIQTLFSTGQFQTSINTRRYDVHPDGERFLMVRQSGDEIVLVQNWFTELEQMMQNR